MGKGFRSALVVVFIIFAFVGAGRATVLTFDDLGGVPPGGVITQSYGGFSWTSVSIHNKDNFAPPSGYFVAAESGSWFAYNTYDRTSEVSRSSPFDFVGAWFTSAWDDTNTLEVRGFLSGQQTFSRDVALVKSARTWVALNFASIDKLTFNTTRQQFAMDNFTFNESGSGSGSGGAPVPEPSTMFLFGAGVAGLVWIRRKRG